MGTSKLRKRLLFLFAIIVLVIVAIRYFYTKDQSHFRKPDQPITDENISQLQLLAELNNPIEYPFQYLSGTIEFSSNSQIIMIGNAEGATVWDSSGTKLRHFKTGVRHNNCSDYGSAEFSLSPDGTLLVASYVACLQSDMQLWSITTGGVLKSFGPDKGLNTLDFSPDSSLILYDYNGKGYVYEVKTDKEILLDNQTLGQMVFASNSNDVFYRANDPEASKFKKWDAGTRSVETLTDQLPGVAFALSPSDTLLAIQDVTRIILWDIAANTEVNVIKTSPSTYWNMEFSSDGRLLILRSTERVIIWDISSQTEILTVNANSYTNAFDSIVNISSDLLVYYQSPGIISIWNLKTKQQATRLKSRSIRPPLAFSPDGTLLVSYSGHVWGIP